MRWASWQHLSGFPKEVPTTVEDLPFEEDEVIFQKDQLVSSHVEGFVGNPSICRDIHFSSSFPLSHALPCPFSGNLLTRVYYVRR